MNRLDDIQKRFLKRIKNRKKSAIKHIVIGKKKRPPKDYAD